MEDSDKLMNLIQKMSKAQLRQVTRFAEFILLEDEPDDLNDRGDMRTRYAAFKDALRIDPAAIDAWVKSGGQK
jgi:DNA polymerase IIIc chi subunit